MCHHSVERHSLLCGWSCCFPFPPSPHQTVSQSTFGTCQERIRMCRRTLSGINLPPSLRFWKEKEILWVYFSPGLWVIFLTASVKAENSLELSLVVVVVVEGGGRYATQPFPRRIHACYSQQKMNPINFSLGTLQYSHGQDGSVARTSFRKPENGKCSWSVSSMIFQVWVFF